MAIIASIVTKGSFRHNLIKKTPLTTVGSPCSPCSPSGTKWSFCDNLTVQSHIFLYFLIRMVLKQRLSLSFWSLFLTTLLLFVFKVSLLGPRCCCIRHRFRNYIKPLQKYGTYVHLPNHRAK